MKLYYEALRKIPKRFIDDKTKCCQFNKHAIMLAHPDYPPMQYCDSDRKWKKIGFNKEDWKVTMRDISIPSPPFKKEIL